jgi:hypothetical protein
MIAFPEIRRRSSLSNMNHAPVQPDDPGQHSIGHIGKQSCRSKTSVKSRDSSNHAQITPESTIRSGLILVDQTSSERKAAGLSAGDGVGVRSDFGVGGSGRE